MIFNPNQGFGNRIANIAFAQGSQNLHLHIIIINIDQEFFPYSIYYLKLFVLKLFWVQ